MIRNNTSNKKPLLCAFGYVDYIILASTIAIALAEDLGADDLNILSTLFAVLSDELALISAVEETCNNNDSSDSNNEDKLIFIEPVPAVSRTSKNAKTVTYQNKVKRHKKKFIRKKIKKK